VSQCRLRRLSGPSLFKGLQKQLLGFGDGHPCTEKSWSALFGSGAAQSLVPGHVRELLLHRHKATRHRRESAERSQNVKTYSCQQTLQH
jgi:hypothetical protein